MTTHVTTLTQKGAFPERLGAAVRDQAHYTGGVGCPSTAGEPRHAVTYMSTAAEEGGREERSGPGDGGDGACPWPTAFPGHDASFRACDLRSIAPELLLPHVALTSLDLSRNELTVLPGLELLQSLRVLDISRNWFKDLPAQVAELVQLEELNAGRNFLRPSTLRPALEHVKARLGRLRVLDLRFNRKCDRQDLLDEIRLQFPAVPEIRLSIARGLDGKMLPQPAGSFVGASPAERDPTLLRSQLEPWPTFVLRQRLVSEFGEAPTDPETFPRAAVMARLLHCYDQVAASAGLKQARRAVRVEGARVSEGLLAQILAALREWAAKHTTANLVRGSC